MWSQNTGNASAHFLRRPVGERDTENLARNHAVEFDARRHTRCEGLGLASSRTGENQDTPQRHGSRPLLHRQIVED